MKKIDLTGWRFGKLTVIRQSKNNKQGRITWECRCECGRICYVSSDCLRRKKWNKKLWLYFNRENIYSKQRENYEGRFDR